MPPPKEAIVDCMEALFNCIKQETSAAVRAVLGHYLFVFIHPYMDGNGRMARFLMNVMFASGDFPWTIIETSKRKTYMNALKTADTKRNLKPLAKFICEVILHNKNVKADVAHYRKNFLTQKYCLPPQQAAEFGARLLGTVLPTSDYSKLFADQLLAVAEKLS